NLRLPGQYADAESGYYYNLNRYYAPELGRYLSEDPIGLEGGINLYSYVNQSPFDYVDLTGELAWFLAPAIGAAIGGGIDLGLQLAQNGGNFSCVSWGQVAASAALGSVGGGFGSAVQKARNIRQAYQSTLQAGLKKNLSAKQAHRLRRVAGARLKQQTPQPFRSIIYMRNMKKYGDPLGPAFDPIKNANVVKTLTDTNPIANSILALPSRGLAPAGAVAGGVTGNQMGGNCDCQ
ncbi:MAG: RHS repeat-associated core domain-containing protein, partial [Venatoribacter sp.]